MGKIKVTIGNDDSGNASELHLVRNHLLDPNRNIDKVIQYAEQRHLMTFLTAGVTSGRYTAPRMTGRDTAKTKISPVPQGELTDTLAWQYKIMGRIQKAVEVIGTDAVGTIIASTSTTGGFFNLKLRDDYLTPGMNAAFPNGKYARVMSRPTGTPGNYIYRFQSYPGDTFVFATWFAGISGMKTIFGGYTTYGERSLRGYAKVHYPDTYINHMTTQRKSISISGDANTNRVLWYEFNGEKGWTYEAEAQARAQFNLEDEHQKWWGISNMKDSNGNLLPSPTQFDDETGEPIVTGDGWVEQVRGANDFETSASDGQATYDDFADLMSSLKKKSNAISGKVYYAVTGSDGMNNALEVIAARGITQGMRFDITHSKEVGGGDPGGIGFNFQTLNVAGNQIIFVENPMMDDEYKFPKRMSNGKLVMSNTFYFVDASPDINGRPNIEIRTRGRQGINRNYVVYWEDGMTGEGKAMSSVDAKAFHILKQNMLVIYNSRGSGILSPPATA